MGQFLIIIPGSGTDLYNFSARNLAGGFAKDQELAKATALSNNNVITRMVWYEDLSWAVSRNWLYLKCGYFD
jgi:hypothetical protein